MSTTEIASSDTLYAFPYPEGHLVCSWSAIQYIEAKGSACLIHHDDGRVVEVQASLSRLEAILPADVFLRVHHSYLVNSRMITLLGKSYRHLELKSGKQLPVATRRRAVLKRAFVFF